MKQSTGKKGMHAAKIRKLLVTDRSTRNHKVISQIYWESLNDLEKLLSTSLQTEIPELEVEKRDDRKTQKQD